MNIPDGLTQVIVQTAGSALFEFHQTQLMNPRSVGIVIQAKDEPNNHPILEIFGQAGSWIIMIETGSLEITGSSADEEMASIVLGSIARGVRLRSHPLGLFWQITPPDPSIAHGEKEIDRKAPYSHFEMPHKQLILPEVFELQFWV